MLAIALYLFKVMLCSSILFAYYMLALRNKKFHSYNRFYLLATVLLSWLIPLIKINFFAPDTTSPQMVKLLTVVASGDRLIEENSVVHRNAWDWNLIFVVVFATISAIFFLQISATIFRLKRLIKNNLKEKWEDIYFVFANTKGTPFSFFKYIFLNDHIDLNSEDGQNVLKHEMAHVRERHSVDKIFISVMLIVSWFNPVIWLIRKELNLIHEFIADNTAISNGDASAFATMLLKATYPYHTLSLANSFFYSPIKRRLLMLTSSRKTSYSYVRRIAVLPLLSVVILFFAFKVKDKKAVSILKPKGVITQKKDNLTIEKKDTGKQKKAIIVSDDNEGIVILRADSFHINPSSETATAAGNVVVRSSRGNTDSVKKPYLIVDGKPALWKELEADKSSPGNIKTVNVLKGKSATDKYGDKGKDGVVEIFTKSAEGSQLENKVYDKVFTVAEDPPSYNKANTTFADYIKANLQYPAEAANKKIEGKVIIKFDVDEDGNLANFQPLTSIGYGLENEAIRLIKNSGPWRPAIQNHRTVVFEVKQEIQFTLKGNAVVSQSTELPVFRNGINDWKRYLERNLDLKSLAAHKAPEGKYTVVVGFVVNKDGNVSNIATETKAGYGTEELAVKTVDQGGRWKPAKKDGNFVDTQVKQTITFTVTQAGWAYVEINSMTIAEIKAIV